MGLLRQGDVSIRVFNLFLFVLILFAKLHFVYFLFRLTLRNVEIATKLGHFLRLEEGLRFVTAGEEVHGWEV